jgi:flagellar biogenesis protein FliO
MTAGPPDIAWPAIAAVVLLCGAALVAHWWLRSRGLVAGASNPIKVVATRAMGTKRALAIVEVDDERFLVGLTDDAISLVSPLRSDRRAVAAPQPLPFGKVG